MAQTIGGYQTLSDLRWTGNGRNELVRDATYGSAILRATWDNASGSRQLELVQTIATNDRGSQPSQSLTDAERRFWTAPRPSMPIDGIVRETADRITAGRTDPRATVARAVAIGWWRRPGAIRKPLAAASAT